MTVLQQPAAGARTRRKRERVSRCVECPRREVSKLGKFCSKIRRSRFRLADETQQFVRSIYRVLSEGCHPGTLSRGALS